MNIKGEKRLVSAAKDLAHERLFGKKHGTSHAADAAYSADNSGDKQCQITNYAIPILILALRLRRRSSRATVCIMFEETERMRQIEQGFTGGK